MNRYSPTLQKWATHLLQRLSELARDTRCNWTLGGFGVLFSHKCFWISKGSTLQTSSSTKKCRTSGSSNQNSVLQTAQPLSASCCFWLSLCSCNSLYLLLLTGEPFTSVQLTAPSDTRAQVTAVPLSRPSPVSSQFSVKDYNASHTSAEQTLWRGPTGSWLQTPPDQWPATKVCEKCISERYVSK